MTEAEIGFFIAGLLFVLGFLAIVMRRSMIFMLIGTEIMLNAAGFGFIAAGSRWPGPEAQVFFIVMLVVAAAEAAVGLALILKIAQTNKFLDASLPMGMRSPILSGVEYGSEDGLVVEAKPGALGSLFPTGKVENIAGQNGKGFPASPDPAVPKPGQGEEKRERLAFGPSSTGIHP